jgi:TRAP-type uncharacterized transport system substrate-binding protein
MHKPKLLNVLKLPHFLLIACVIGLLGFAIWRSVPPSTVTIETGPVGGSYYEVAAKYADRMRARGINVVLRPNPDSLGIINDIEREDSGADIGFTAQDIARDNYPHVRSAGAVELQPLFTFVQRRLGDIASPAQLRGKRIVMPPEHSATSQAAIALLRLYDVTADNTKFTFTTLTDAAAVLKSGAADAGFFMLEPQSQLIAGMTADPNLQLVGTGDGRAITRHLPFLRVATLSHGSFDIGRNIPAHDTDLLAATVNVVVRSELHPAVLYTLLDAMKDVHHDATLISDAADFPSVVGTDLLPEPLAVDYSKDGEPWIFRHLPLPVASLIDAYLVIGVALLICAEVYKHIVELGELLNLIMEHLCLRTLAYIERRAVPGQPLSPSWRLAIRLVERALENHDKRKRSEELMKRLHESWEK